MPSKLEPNGWNYVEAKERMGRIAENIVALMGENPEDYWKIGGGKGFGLCICDAICRLAGEFPEKTGPRIILQVPPWLSISSSEKKAVSGIVKKWRKQYPGLCIFRSSESSEDWADPKAGVYDSTMVDKEDPAGVVGRMLDLKMPFIIQRGERGIGFVIDIAFSKILQKNVVRLAHGGFISKQSGYYFTSATYDFDSRFGLYEESGNPIIPLEEVVFCENASEAAKLLAWAVRRVGINFGVQLEIIVHPLKPHIWHLVQIRPSPGSLQGGLEIPEGLGRELGITPKVNRIGSAYGELLNFSFTENADKAEMLLHVAREGRASSFFAYLRLMLEGKIILWSDVGVSKQDLLKIVHAAKLLGAAGQISYRTLYHISAHKNFHIFTAAGSDVYENSISMHLIFSVHQELHEKISRESGRKIALLSDGLVGAIHKK